MKYYLEYTYNITCMWRIGFWMDGSVSHLETEFIKVLFSYCGMASVDVSTVSRDES